MVGRQHSPFVFLVLSCLSHAASGVLVDVFLRLHAHSVLDSAHDIHLPVRLLKAFERSLLLLLREREAELLFHRLIAAIVAKRWKRQKLKWQEEDSLETETETDKSFFFLLD